MKNKSTKHTQDSKYPDKKSKSTKDVKKVIVKTSKSQKVKEHLIANKQISSWEAIQMYGVTRLSARIYDLREKGWVIDSKSIEFTDRFGNAGTYALYTLISQPKSKDK